MVVSPLEEERKEEKDRKEEKSNEPQNAQTSKFTKNTINSGFCISLGKHTTFLLGKLEYQHKTRS